MSRNEITGDSICTKPSRSKAYESNYDAIFRKRKKCVECGDEIEAWELHEVGGELFHKRCFLEEG